MRHTRHHSQGFTLIAALLILLLLSGLSIGLMMMVNTEGKVGGADLRNDIAYHNAEGGIEKMTSDLAAVFRSAQAPQASDICGLSNLPPNIPGVTWKDYDIRPVNPAVADPCNNNNPPPKTYGQIASGPNKDLWAIILPVSMTATAAQPGGQEVSMVRSAQVALIPVFQFGIFSESDLSFFSGPNFDFAGRVHTNGDLYPEVGGGSTLRFHDKITAYGNVIRTQLANGFPTASNYAGTVKVPTADKGCDLPETGCRALALTEGSILGAGGFPPQSDIVSGWTNLSQSTYHTEILSGDYGIAPNAGPMHHGNGTGAKLLSMPFVNDTTHPYEIIRRPQPTDSLGLSQSREYNLAQIRILLSDSPADLPGGAADPGNIRLSNGLYGSGPNYTFGVPVIGAGPTFFAEGSTATSAGVNTTGMANCISNATLAASADWPYAPNAAANTPPMVPTGWNLLDGYLRVEYIGVDGQPHPATREWLQYGFARGLTPTTTPNSNPVHPNAILVLQQPADRNGNGAIEAAYSGNCNGATPNKRPAELALDALSNSNYFGDGTHASVTRYNWYPINFYDTREGEIRDNNLGNNSCTAAGVMNTVELDVGNLKKWLLGLAPYAAGNGKNVDSATQNGWVLYFSDRRGMLGNPNKNNAILGDSGLEDSINAGSNVGTPDHQQESPPPGHSGSPEDVNQDGNLDDWGRTNLGLGFYNPNGDNINAKIVASGDPYATTAASPRITSCGTTGRKNWVSGARHVLRLTDGRLDPTTNPIRGLPVRADNTGGFTVASENPVYILGDYNTYPTDPAMTGGADQAGHAAAAVIADSVTLLSNNWSDLNSTMAASVTALTSRAATTSWYRVAIAGGKNINFSKPNWAGQDFGTDGGVHNFLRYIENWGGQALNYKGSLVSMYYSTYETGVFKCCTTVYSPPTRNYSFDKDFTVYTGMPPGTPMFRDVDTLGYRQVFTARTN